jgi:hypothetical protein
MNHASVVMVRCPTGESKEEKHNPTLITGEDFAAPTFIVRRLSFPLARFHKKPDCAGDL